MAELVTLAFRIQDKEVVDATKNLGRMAGAAGVADKAADGLAVSQGKTAHESRMLALQLSQVAQQGMATGMFLQAFAMQLPDMVIGMKGWQIAAVSLGSVLATTLLMSSKEAEKGLSDLSATTKSLADNFDVASDGSYLLAQEFVRLAQISDEVARLKLNIDTETARRNVLELGNQLSDTFRELTGDQFLSALDKLEGITIGDKIGRQLGITAEQAIKLRSELLTAAQSTNPDDYNQLAATLSQLSSEYDQSYGKVQNFVGQLAGFVEEGLNAATMYNRLTDAGGRFDELLDRSTVDEARDRYAEVTSELQEMTAALFRTTAAQEQHEYLSRLDSDATFEQKIAVASLVTTYQQLRAEMESLDARRQAEIDNLSELSRQMEYINERTRTDQERVTDTYLESLYRINDAELKRVIDHEQATAMRLAVDEEYAQASLAIEEQLAAQKRMHQQQEIGAAADTAGNLAQIAQAGGKKSFEAYKQLASVQAVIASYLAATKALAEVPYPLNIAAAASIAALGAVQVAQIQSQEYQGSYEGGGFTGPGSRSGGIDGRGGFPAILHPNEVITDLTRSAPVSSQQRGVVVNNNVPGVMVETEQMTAEDVITIIATDTARGGRTARASSRAFGLRRRAR